MGAGRLIIKAVQVRNYRSIVSETLQCEALTALVGRNGAGKSAFLRALDLFYSPNARCDVDEFFNRDQSLDVEITVTFQDLLQEELDRFHNYVRHDNLVVCRVFSLANAQRSGKFFGYTLQNPEFREVRNATAAVDYRRLYTELRSIDRYPNLPAATSREAINASLSAWERQYPDQCQLLQDDGQFFGFKEVAQGYLGKSTRYLFIPAVRDASADALDGRGSTIAELMDLVVRATLASNTEISSLRQEVQARYDAIVRNPTNTGMADLADTLTATLHTYVSEVSVALDWRTDDGVDLSLPRADVRLLEDGFRAPVDRTGHGLQRAFILTMLQHLAIARTPEAAQANQVRPDGAGLVEGARPNLILAIEEPELYQHPSRQRHFAAVLLKLAGGQIAGVAEKTQVLYATHSPLFVGIDRWDHIRMLRKVPTAHGGPKHSTVVMTNLMEIAGKIEVAQGVRAHSFTTAGLRARLTPLMTPMVNEGFFADVVVLVEGDDDRAAILGAALAMGHDLESEGFAVVPCGGKSNLVTAAAVFRSFQIPTYCIWDGDAGLGASAGRCPGCDRPLDGGADPSLNHTLLRFVGRDPIDWPNEVADEFACFECNLEQTLECEVGKDLFDQLLDEERQAFGMQKRKHAVKNPAVVSAVLLAAIALGHGSPTLHRIVDRVVALKPD